MRLAAGCGTNGIVLFDLAGGEEAGWLNDPTGAWLASAAGDGVRLWDLASGTGAGRLEVPGLDAGGPMAFSPSGDRLALAVRDDGAARRFGVRLFDLIPA